MKLLMDATNIASGGGLVVLCNYIRAWSELEIPMDITAIASRRDVIDKLKKAGGDIEVLEFCAGKSEKAVYFNTLFNLGREIDKLKPDVVFATNRFVPRCHTPQLVHQQNLWRFDTDNLFQSFRKGPVRFLRDRDSRRSFRRAGINTFISDHMREQALRLAPDCASRFYTVYNGLSAQMISRSYSLENKWDGRPTVAALLDIGLQKDYPTMLRTFAALVKKRPDLDWKFSIAFPRINPETRKMAEELGISQHIDWLGYLDECGLCELFQTSMCLVYTSFFEGFGLPPLESMINGCPAVVCDSTALPEIVGDAAIKVPPHDHEAFASAVLSLYENPELRNDFVQRGLTHAREFSWHKSAKKMFDLLKSIK